jgi:hypothetical protein
MPTIFFLRGNSTTPYFTEHLGYLDGCDEIASFVEDFLLHVVPMLLVEKCSLPELSERDRTLRFDLLTQDAHERGLPRFPCTACDLDLATREPELASSYQHIKLQNGLEAPISIIEHRLPVLPAQTLKWPNLRSNPAVREPTPVE